MNAQLLWFISRATGIASIVMLTAILVLGMVLARRRAAHSTVPLTVMALHRWLSLGMVVFLAAHIVTAIADGYVDISWLAVVIPFTSGYETFFIALGTLSLDLLIAIMVTSWFRHRIPEKLWESIHILAYAMWPLGLAHGFFLGTENEPILRGITIACGVIGVASLIWRLTGNNPDAQRREQALKETWS